MTNPAHYAIASVTLVTQAIGVCLVAHRLAARLVPARSGTLLLATVAWLLVLTQVIGLTLLLGAAHLLSLPTSLAAQLLLGAIVLYGVRPSDVPRLLPRRLERNAATVLCLGAVALFLALVISVRGPSHEFDTMHYHVVDAAQWMNAGNTWDIPYSDPAATYTGTYPGDAELVGTWLILPTHSDQLAYMAPLAFAILCVLGMGAAMRELGVPLATGVLAGLATVTSPLAFTQLHTLDTDMAVAAGLVTAAALILHGVRHPTERRWPALAGIALGLACGSKYTALAGAAGVLVLQAAFAPPVGRARVTAITAATALPLCVFWFVRNAVITSNPIYPQQVSIGSHVVWTGAAGNSVYTGGSSLAHRLLTADTGVLLQWGRDMLEFLGPVALLAVAGMGAGIVTWRRGSRAMSAVALLAVLSTVAYMLTPQTGGVPGFLLPLVTSDTRLALPAVVVAVCAAAAALPRTALSSIAGAALAYNAVRIGTTGGPARPDLRPDLILAALAALLSVLTAAALLWMLRTWALGTCRSGRFGRWVLGGSAVGTVAVGALVLSALPRSVDHDTVASALLRSGQPHGRVAVVDIADVRDLLGPMLDRDIVAVGDGVLAQERPLGRAADFDARLTDAGVSVAVIAPGPVLPQDWTPPSGWVLVGREAGGSVFIVG